MSTILTEIIKSWYPLPHMSVNHDVISGSASILKWNGKEKQLIELVSFICFLVETQGILKVAKCIVCCPAKSEHIKSSMFDVDDEGGKAHGSEEN